MTTTYQHPAAAHAWAVRALTPDEAARAAWLRGDYAAEAQILAASEAAESEELERIEAAHAAEIERKDEEIAELTERLETLDSTPEEVAATARARANEQHRDALRHAQNALREIATCLQTKACNRADGRRQLARLLRDHAGRPDSAGAIAAWRTRTAG